MTPLRWLEDQVADYVWAGGILRGDVDGGMLRLARILDVVEEARSAAGEGKHEPVDGGLVAFESIPPRSRDAVIKALRYAGLAHVVASEGFINAIQLYEAPPGGWLVGLSERDAAEPDRTLAEDYLSGAIATIADGRGRGGTAVKATVFRQLMLSGSIHFAAEGTPVEELKRYPGGVTDDERKRVESFIRASYGAFQGIATEQDDDRVAWARQFWGANWTLFPCREDAGGDPTNVGSEDEENAPNKDQASDQGTASLDASSEATGAEETSADSDPDAIGEQIYGFWNEFLTLAYESDPQLYDPARHEVLSGLAAHGLRVTIAVAAHPGLWVGEFSAPLLRTAVEVLIDLAWFATDEGRDESAPHRFKDFGRGRLKLVLLNFEDVAAKLGTNPLVEEILETLDEEVNREIGENFQDISLEATFTGRDLRKMAMAAGVEPLYKLQLSPMSSVVHAEWPMLTRYAMRLCINPVHRLHWMPRTNLEPAVRPQAGAAALVIARQIVDLYRRAMETSVGGAARSEATAP
jgi:hypothetical protein